MQGGKQLLLVIGGESSGTRILADLLASHPDVSGGSAETHGDWLDAVWQAVAEPGPAPTFPPCPTSHAVTRRSLPHGPAPGEPARFMAFPDLAGFAAAARSAGFDLQALITCRNPVAHLASWTVQRDSVAGDPARAAAQYEAAYRHAFDFVGRCDVPFRICPLEALLLDGQRYLDALCAHLGLAPGCVAYRPPEELNSAYLDEALARP